MRRHIVPVGLPGAGKTSVAAHLAGLLSTPCSEVDAMIADRAGTDIPSLFRAQGEGVFRSLEAEIMEELLKGPAHVISPGGGWILGVSNIGTVISRALVIYLETDPIVALDRIGDVSGRPLLGDGTPEVMERLLASRVDAYRQAEARVKTDGLTVSAVADCVADLARNKAGW